MATAWRNGQYVVSYVQPGVRGAPPLGAVLKSCNAEPIEDLAKAKLDQFEGDLTTEAGRVRSAPYLLWNRNNPMTTGVPGTCEFQVGRRTRDFTLSPQPATAQNLEAAYRASVYVPSGAPLSVETVNEARGSTSTPWPMTPPGTPSSPRSRRSPPPSADRRASCSTCAAPTGRR